MWHNLEKEVPSTDGIKKGLCGEANALKMWRKRVSEERHAKAPSWKRI